jgi:hypothetical protein
MTDKPQIPAHLQAAKDEIAAILAKYDVAGVVVVHGEQDGQAFILNHFKIDPSYSLVYYTGKVLQVKPLPPALTLSMNPPQVQDNKAPVFKTLNMLGNMRGLLEHLWSILGTAEMLVKAKFDVTVRSEIKNPPNSKS